MKALANELRRRAATHKHRYHLTDRDMRTLAIVAERIERGDLSGAYRSAQRLDVICRDCIPPHTWVAMERA